MEKPGLWLAGPRGAFPGAGGGRVGEQGAAGGGGGPGGVAGAAWRSGGKEGVGQGGGREGIYRGGGSRGGRALGYQYPDVPKLYIIWITFDVYFFDVFIPKSTVFFQSIGIYLDIFEFLRFKQFFLFFQKKWVFGYSWNDDDESNEMALMTKCLRHLETQPIIE